MTLAVPQTSRPAESRDVGSGHRLRYTSLHRGTLSNAPVLSLVLNRLRNERLRDGAALANSDRLDLRQEGLRYSRDKACPPVPPPAVRLAGDRNQHS